MDYGARELAFARPFAEALASDADFKTWVLERTKFASVARQAKLLDADMLAARGRSATWWRSHYTSKCHCLGCNGQETDLLAIFEQENLSRFALHVEVKQPTDSFPANKDQASNYAIRANCWVQKPPKSVLAHSDAETMLLCSESRLADYTIHLKKFGSVLTFEQVAQAFPQATPTETGDPRRDNV